MFSILGIQLIGVLLSMSNFRLLAFQEEEVTLAIVVVIGLAIFILALAGVWKVFTKAGQPGWACIVPIYNLVVLMRIAGRPGWWVLLMLIPIVSIIIAFIVAIDVAKNFGKGAGFGVGLALLGIIFYPILGFGDAQYRPIPK